MPDIWTKHPNLVRDLLTDAGFRCGVEPRFLAGRDPAWTCAVDGQRLKGDLYIHHLDRLRSETASPVYAGLAPARPGDGPGAVAALLLLAAVLAVRSGRRRRPAA